MKFLLTILFSMVTAFAAGSPSSPAKAATAALENLSKDAVVFGSFKQVKHIQKISRDFESTGNFIIADGQGIVWDVQKPFKNSLVITDSKMVQRSANGSVSTMNASENAVFAEFSKTIQSVFSGNMKLLEQNFTVKFDKRQDRWVMTLVPKEKTIRQVIQSIELSGKETLSAVAILDGDGNTMTYTFIDQKNGTALTEAQKKFFDGI